MRIILYTGKGGVGKTSVSAATALKAAKLGYRTVVMSTDPAHSLGDSFDMPLGAEPTPITANLWGQEIDVLKEMDTYWKTVRVWLSTLMRWQGMDDVVADEVAVLPGMEELVGLLYINRYQEAGQFDLVIVDCAPTGETLRLLSFPDMARWYMNKIFPLERMASKALKPVVRPLLRNFPVPGEDVFSTIEFLFRQIETMREILTDPRSSSVRLVVNAEKMVIKEAQRAFTYLNLYGYATDLVVCNRLLPEGLDASFFEGWKASQTKHYSTISENFSPIPIKDVPLFEQEVVGLEMLDKMGDSLFGKEDPSKVFFEGYSQEIRKRDSKYILSLPVPFVTKDDLSLLKSGGDLVVQAGHYRRNIMLPRVLAALSVEEAKLDDGKLKLTFSNPGEQAAKAAKRS